MMLLALVAFALASPSPGASSSPVSAPSFVPVASPVPVARAYAPEACGKIIVRAHLDGKPITADNLGRLMAQALKDHGFRPDRALDTVPVAKAIVDFAGCFQPRK